MLATANLKEHRREARRDTNTLIKFRPEAYKTEEKFAVILDINDLGASLFSYCLFPIGTRIVIDKGDNLQEKADIVTVGFDKDSDMIRFGVTFVKEEPKELPKELKEDQPASNSKIKTLLNLLL